MKANGEIVTLQVPAEAEYIDLVRLTLYGIASKIGFSYEEIEDMKVAVSEACNNVVLHAYSDAPNGRASERNPGHRMEIRFIRLNDALSIIVKDEGRSFDADAAARKAEPLHGKSVGELEAGGLGLYLMQALMDQVEVHSETGTEVVMTKRLAKSGELA
ncbi:anti-sigma B factor RsbW [Paenibacillus cisolokensis]|uniref:Serine-protein kinase RsbW n=1 Tax=Paenibacillus cisolokensis TaxID=1658519 RepID=A0ABQ4NF73_9BACL|nr:MULTISPECIES: anti-sigma B factor RsbW [Paenibacillus]ALS26519.1 serine/threonine protein kinase [Paenibacillus sp. 32O-W]GIQ66832.1 serine-protein kinase RsbW [Paenibacillus cisolokensis]